MHFAALDYGLYLHLTFVQLYMHVRFFRALLVLLDSVNFCMPEEIDGQSFTFLFWKAFLS